MNTPDSQDEEALLQAVANGDEQAFARLFTRYYHFLGRHVFRLTRSMEMAEEIVQDVFLKIWMSREALEGVNHFRSYLYVISKNHALNALKKKAREQVKQKVYQGDMNNAATVSATDEVEGLYYSLIDQAIERLPAQQQRVYVLSRRQQKKYEEIAAEMGISRETVKKYLQLATVAISHYVRSHMDPALIALLLLAPVLYDPACLN
ncbi:RNA polymerase sigma-70 factor, ECF subfamily [Hydrobacter penzbergensis]|uniref:RNA polymerase sigma factor n=1 Tax=Hydrobacter penzbergensis TaxID=1235997 RepID=A0A8X8LC45_9BACT|nr:sigma-70 family RNA polymerase sigma factor [Hydrobacter penzbergensis]SDW03866.1 RNA polymerase sigma-70 factor, ECF subfamily [Hydrobacter penzbergensis]